MKQKIWIVEDDKEILELLEFIAESNGYDVFGSRDLEGANRLLEDAKTNSNLIPSLLISDYHLINGNTEQWLIKVRKNFPELRIVCCSGGILLVDSLENIKKHAIEFHEKPMTLSEILKILKNKSV